MSGRSSGPAVPRSGDGFRWWEHLLLESGFCPDSWFCMHLGKVHFCRAGMPPGAPPQSRERLYISGVMGAWWAVRHACGAPHDSSCAWCPTRLVMRVVPHTTRHARGAPHDSSCSRPRSNPWAAARLLPGCMKFSTHCKRSPQSLCQGVASLVLLPCSHSQKRCQAWQCMCSGWCSVLEAFP